MANAEKPEYGPKQEKALNELLETNPEKDKTEAMDTRRLEWWQRAGELMAESKDSLGKLKESKDLDDRRITWWKEVADKKSTET